MRPQWGSSQGLFVELLQGSLSSSSARRGVSRDTGSTDGRWCAARPRSSSRSRRSTRYAPIPTARRAGAPRHLVGGRRTRVPRFRLHRALRATAHLRANPRRHRRGQKTRSNTGSTAAQKLINAGLSPGQAAKQLGIGQRLTESQRRCVEGGIEVFRALRVILRTNLAMTPPSWEYQKVLGGVHGPAIAASIRNGIRRRHDQKTTQAHPPAQIGPTHFLVLPHVASTRRRLSPACSSSRVTGRVSVL